MTDDWMTAEHKEAARQGAEDLARSVVENAPAWMLEHELRRRECATNGHDYNVISSASGPVQITCPCGAMWDVTPAETSTAADPAGDRRPRR